MGSGTLGGRMTEQERKQFEEMVATINVLAEIIPDIREIVKERQEQEIFNRKAAKIGRYILVIAGAIGTVLGTMWAVSKLIFTLGSVN